VKYRFSVPAFFLIAAVLAPVAAAAQEVTIRFYDRTLYFAGPGETNPVSVLTTIRNTGSDTLRFKLADDRAFSVDFVARTVRNGLLQQTPTLVRKRTAHQTVFFREIALETGESYSFIENLKDYLDIVDPSVYYLEARFYPELYKTRDTVTHSNQLVLEVLPAPSVAAGNPLPVDMDTLAILVPESISPDRVVEQTIVARQRSQWDRYFLYLDIEEMLKKDPVRSRKYRAASAEERRRQVNTYKADLQQTRIDQDIVAIPAKYQVERTVYEQDEGTVTVLEWFKYDTFTEKKRYTYYVHQRDDIWRIYNFIVENLGTE
jgi:hypothetical protein